MPKFRIAVEIEIEAPSAQVAVAALQDRIEKNEGHQWNASDPLVAAMHIFPQREGPVS